MDVPVLRDGCFVGIDGCRGGWLAACLDRSGLRLFLLRRIGDFSDAIKSASLVFVDMPLGLTDNACGRKCETEARQLMPSNYKASIFLCPCRSAVYAGDYQSANSLQRQKTGKGLSVQAWNIGPKIKELDEAVLSGDIAYDDLFESHPEMCFAFLNGGTYLHHKKKTKEGAAERIALLQSFVDAEETVQGFMKQTKRKDLAIDDVLDAVCLAVAAKEAGTGSLGFLPAGRPQINGLGQELKIALPLNAPQINRRE